MKSLLLGFFGGVLGVIAVLVVASQYSDYVASSQTSSWLNEIQPYTERVSERIRRNGGVRDAGIGMISPALTVYAPKFASIRQDGVILLQGGDAGQTVALIPSYADGRVTWHCVGGSKRHALSCERWTLVSEAPKGSAR